MPEQDDQDDRFGTSPEAFAAAREAHGHIFRTGMYIPTRREVATKPPDEIYEILDLWLWESPTELIPRQEQIEEVLKILESRPDRKAVAKSIAECHRYLEI